jgi:predicted GNAT family N-acyltransferase
LEVLITKLSAWSSRQRVARASASYPPIKMTLSVSVVETPEDKQIAMRIRHRVFIDEQKFDAAIEVDEHDDEPTTVHFIGKDVEQDKHVAVARVLLDEQQRKAKIGRVAVLSECRGKNYGVALMKAVEDALRHRVDRFVLSAQYDKKVFYERCGYACTSDEVYLEEGVEHCWMVKSAAE